MVTKTKKKGLSFCTSIAPLLLSFLPLVLSTKGRLAVITGATRGIGKGISEKLAASGEYQGLLLCYNAEADTAQKFAQELSESYKDIKVEILGGDLVLQETRDKIFEVVDTEFEGYHLATIVHNAGQYVGVTSDNAVGLKPNWQIFGDGSMLKDDGTVDFQMIHYYQKLYGDAYIDLCERGLARMRHAASQCEEDKSLGPFRGSLVGISSPGVNGQHPPNKIYSTSGAGKVILEYASRIMALNAASIGVNSNVVIPGATKTDSWERSSLAMGWDKDASFNRFLSMVPMGEAIYPSDVADLVAFLCAQEGGGRFVTGQSILLDGGFVAAPKF